MKNNNLLLLMTLLPSIAFSHNLSLGQPVPSVSIDTYGELLFEDGKIAYSPWKTQDMLGKVRIIQAVAGRSKAKEMNAPLMSAITAAHFPASDYQTTTIINQEDAIWGTGTFVKSATESSKKEFYWSSIVLDKNGTLASHWHLQKESSAIIVQNKQGALLFVKEGALNEPEILKVIELVEENI